MPVSDSVEPFKLTSTATRVTKVTCVTSAERPLDRRRNCENTRNDTLTANQSNVTCVARCFFVKVKTSSFCVSKPILVFVKPEKLHLRFDLMSKGVIPQSDLSSTIIVSRCYNDLNFFLRLTACSGHRRLRLKSYIR